ncbi:MAG: fibronectin type III domain-containing protein, partial [Flavitalea sp.]
MKRVVLLMSIMLGLVGTSISQDVFTPSDPTVRYDPKAAYGSATKPDSNIIGIQKWVSAITNGVSSGSGAWDATSYKSYFINYFNVRLAFRIKFPKSYNNPDSVNKKYPVMLFMHGAGEVGCVSNGGIYNNEKQLILGGQLFASRVDNNQFDGFLLYPQLRSPDSGCWGQWADRIYNYNTIITILDTLNKYNRGDIDRVFIDGLSGGGVATWKIAETFPQRIAKIAPTSAAGIPMNWAAFIHIPVWLATGGKDTNPSPDMALYTETHWLALGGYMRRSLYADLGHASWYRHWQETDFVPFMNDLHKANPLIFFNRFEFCPDSAINARIGITQGFYAYEWQKDSVTIATSTNGSNTIINPASIISYTGNEITVKSFGSYRVRFKRTLKGDWSIWSPKPAVIQSKTTTQTPPIQVVGLNSKTLPTLDGKSSVQLTMAPGFMNYQWYRTTDNALVSTSQIFDAPVGSYKARYSEQYGCGTLFSDVFKVVNAKGTPKPDAAKNLTVAAVSQTGLRLDWSDNPNAGTNETGFEIYRATKAGGPYTLINITLANVITYQDLSLIPNSKYYYVVRSVAETGAAATSNEASATTQVDNQPPTAPTTLEYRGSTSTAVYLRWKAATDNVGVARYDIYVNGVELYSTTNLEFPVGNLDSLTSYNFTVKAIDKAGNASANSNQVLGYTHRQGLNFKYYTGSYNTLPDFNALTPIKTGIMDSVFAGQGIRTQDDAFAFYWEGRIYIPVAGNYTFETASDDGSKLYIDVPYSFSATALVNNDGAHGVVSQFGTKYLTQGYHNIVMTFNEIGGGEEMSVYWSSSTGIARERLPKNFLALDDFGSATVINAPSSLVATPVSYKMVNLKWKDNSNNETGFEIVRSTSVTGAFTSIATVAANTTSYADSMLTAGTAYYYKIRAISSNGESSYSYGFTEANWQFNNNYSDANGTSAYTLGSTSTSFSNSDKVEGSHAVVIANNGFLSFNTGTGGFPSIGGYNQRTIAAWIKPTTTSGKRMIIDIGGSDNGLGIRFNNNDLQGGVASGSVRSSITLSSFASNGNWLSNQWNHVALVYNVNSITLYLNGVSVASNVALSFNSIANSTNVSRIGNYSGSNVFNDGSYSTWTGSLDNVFIIRGALLKSEIDSIRSNTFAPSVATTLGSPAPPVAPNALTAQVLTTDAIALSWNDNSDNETGFEIWRSTGNKSNNRMIKTVAGGSGSTKSFTDSALFANVIYYYTVRAVGDVAASAFTSEIAAKTLNTKPVLKRLIDFTMKYATSFALPVSATDDDGDPLTFTTQSLPTFGVISTVTNGQINITFSPSITKRGSYPITVFVSDGNGGKDTSAFTLIVNNNDVPVLSTVKDTAISEGGQFILPLSATDNDGSSQMVWSFDGLPSFGVFTNNNNGTGTLTFNPGYSASGVYPVTVILNDGYGAWTSRTFTLTVNEKDPDETLQFNFRTQSATVVGWNNVTVVNPGFSHGTIYDTKGNVSSAALSIVSGVVTSSIQGPQTGNNSGPFPDLVMKDIMLWGFNIGTNQYDTVVMKVSGLDPAKNYNFIFYAGYNLNGISTSVARYKIGNQVATINYYQNTTKTDTIKGAQPNSAGEIVVQMLGDAVTSRGGLLNAMVIKANFDDGSTPTRPLDIAGKHIQNSGVLLTWTERAYNETGYYVYRASTKAGPYTLLNSGATNRDSASYSDGTVVPLSQYYYYVAGVNAYGIGASSDTILVSTGNNAPVITTVGNIYVKTDAVDNTDFTVTDDTGDAITVSLQNAPSFVKLQNLGGSNYRITTSPLTDHIGWFSVQVNAVDDKGAVSQKTISITISDKNTRSVFLNFGSATKVADAPWNNWLGYKGTNVSLVNLKDEKNTVTPFGITMLVPFSNLNDMGHLSGNNSGVYPDSVLQSGFADNSGVKSFKFTGLNAAMKYNIVLMASVNEGGIYTTEYSSGSTKDTLNARYNTNQTANLNGLVPDASGQLTVNITRINGALWTYLNAVVLEEYDPSTVVILNPINLYVEPVSRTSVDLSWSDRTSDEDLSQGYILERASDSLFSQNLNSVSLPANTRTYRNVGLAPNTKYWYRVKAQTAGAISSDYSNRVKTITPAVCANELPYIFNGKTYTLSGNYIDTVKSAVGCDTVYTIQLTVTPLLVKTISPAVCANQLPYIFNG